ncbi:hypothetical protein OSTOST_15911, partial [Ostertagia ostertagi]
RCSGLRTIFKKLLKISYSKPSKAVCGNELHVKACIQDEVFHHTLLRSSNDFRTLVFFMPPTYAVIMLFDVTLFTYVSSGPFWRPIERARMSPRLCMGWTWYLANDIQLHYVVAPILFIAFATNIRWGMLIGGLMMAGSSIIQLWIVIENDYPPAPILTAKLQIVKTLDRILERCLCETICSLWSVHCWRDRWIPSELSDTKSKRHQMGPSWLDLLNSARPVLCIRLVRLCPYRRYLGVLESVIVGPVSVWRRCGWVEVLHAVVEDHLLCLSSSSNNATDLQFQSSTTVSLHHWLSNG